MRLVKRLKTFFSADCSVVEGFWRVQRQRHICYLRWKRCEKNYWTKQKGRREFLSSGCFTPLLIARGDCVKLTSQKLAWAQNIRQSWRRHRLTKSSCRRCDKRSQVKVRSRLNNDRWKLERSDLRMRQLRPPLTSQSHQQLVIWHQQTNDRLLQFYAKARFVLVGDITSIYSILSKFASRWTKQTIKLSIVFTANKYIKKLYKNCEF